MSQTILVLLEIYLLRFLFYRQQGSDQRLDFCGARELVFYMHEYPSAFSPIGAYLTMQKGSPRAR